jgi:lipoate-protein ligase A
MDWRTIPFRRYDPYRKTGLNDAALRSAEQGQATFWFAGWDRACINVGRSQRVSDEVDLTAAREDSIPIVRRQGGGGAMYLTPDGEITWGLAAPSSTFPDGLEDIYAEVCGRVVAALEDIGIDARHEPINDVVTPGGKISGATARRGDGAVYVGGTLLYRIDPDEAFRYLTPGEEKDKHRESDLGDRITSINDRSDASRDDVIAAVRKAFLHDRRTDKGDWTDDERAVADEQAQTYRSEEWLFMHED